MRNRETDNYDLESKINMLESENRELKKKIEGQLKWFKMREQARKWTEEAKALGEEDPEFNLDAVADNPQFLNMLEFGIDMKSAYYALCHDEILDRLVKKAKEDASLKITDSIRTKGKRPDENGLSGKSAAVFKTDVSKLTPKERAEIAKRARKGETIKF